MFLFQNVSMICYAIGVVGGATILFSYGNWPLALAAALGAAMTGLLFQAVHEVLNQLRGIRTALERQQKGEPSKPESVLWR